MKKVTAFLIAILIVLSLCAYGETATRDTLVFLMDQEPATMDPQHMSDGASYGITANLYDTLIWINDEGELEPMLAKSWEISEDGLTYTFYLEEDVDFQNGEHFTAADAKYTFDRALESSFTSAATSFIDSCRVVDDYTFEVSLESAYAPALSCFGSQYLRIVNQKAVEEAGDSFSFDPGLAGTGPYILESWTSGESLTLVANEDYWRGAPAIKQVTVRFISDLNTKNVAMQTGDADMGSLSLLNIAEIEANSNLTYEIVPGQTVNYIGFNTQTEPFDDPKVRQAISYSIDKEELLLVAQESLLGGTLTAIPVKETGFGFNPDLEVYPKDIEKAKELLAEAGYADGFSCNLYVGNQTMRLNIATYLQACLAEIGIDMQIEVMESAALQEEIRAGNTEMFIMGANAFASDADLYLYNMYHSEGSVNFTHTNDSWLDEKLEEARVCTDTTQREALYMEITQYIYDNCFDIPNFWINSLYAYDKDLVVDMIPNASGYFFYEMHWSA